MQRSAERERTLLVISGGRDAVPVIGQARRLGLRVVVSDGAPDAPGFRLADAGLLASTHDPDATVEAARAYAARTPIDGVLAAAAVPVTAAAVAHALELPGLAPTAAELVADKLATRERLRERGVPVPWFAAVESPAALAAFAAGRARALVVKPVDSSGARGIVRLLRGVDPIWAYGVAAAESPTGRVMVEDFVAGPQLTAEAALVRGRATTLAIADRNYEMLDRFAPFMVDNGGELPSRLPDSTLARVEATIAAAVAALDLGHGALRASLAVTDAGPQLIDLAAGLGHGYFCSHEIPLATGIELVPIAIGLALGDEPDDLALSPRWSQGVAERYFFPAPGVVTAVRGAPEAAVGEGVALLEVRVAPGERVRPVSSHLCRGGVVVAVGETREVAVARAEAAAARVRIITGPAASILSPSLH
jgi:biotin carboxylase